MPRIVKEEDYAARRNEILDVARKLVYTKGYEQMSIQDILGELKISKGALYQYFDSKPALLEAGPITELAAKEAGLTNLLVAKEYTTDGLITALNSLEVS